MDILIKEEKLEIKHGILNKSPGDQMNIFKRWKPRYFVFCEIKKGESCWLKLYYYDSKSSYTKGKLPINFIDVTSADHIGMMDREMDGHDHIIQISTPGRKYYLSASSCDDMFHWILPLRSYKFNDESQLPWLPKRAGTWNAPPDVAKLPRDQRRNSMNLDLSPKNEHACFLSNEKLRRTYLFCKKCLAKKDEYVPDERYGWIRPVNGEESYSVRAKPKEKENIYEEVPINTRYVSQHPINLSTTPYVNVREQMPLPVPFSKIKTEASSSDAERGSSCSDSESFHSGESASNFDVPSSPNSDYSKHQTVPSIYVHKEQCTPISEASNVAFGHREGNLPAHIDSQDHLQAHVNDQDNIQAVSKQGIVSSQGIDQYVDMKQYKNTPNMDVNPRRKLSLAISSTPKSHIGKSLSIPYDLNKRIYSPLNCIASESTESLPSFQKRSTNNSPGSPKARDMKMTTGDDISMRNSNQHFYSAGEQEPKQDGISSHESVGRTKLTEHESSENDTSTVPVVVTTGNGNNGESPVSRKGGLEQQRNSRTRNIIQQLGANQHAPNFSHQQQGSLQSRNISQQQQQMSPQLLGNSKQKEESPRSQNTKQRQERQESPQLLGSSQERNDSRIRGALASKNFPKEFDRIEFEYITDV